MKWEFEKLREENAKLRNTLKRIAIGYPVVAGPDTCPPPPHACDKCEIYFLLNELNLIEELTPLRSLEVEP